MQPLDVVLGRSALPRRSGGMNTAAKGRRNEHRSKRIIESAPAPAAGISKRPDMPSVRPYLSAEQLAAVTPWSVNAIWKMTGRGMLQRNVHYFRPLGRRREIVFKWSAIVALIEGREQTEPENPGAAWLEQQTGVNCVTLRKHYGRWMAGEVESELQQFAAFDKTLFGRSEAKLFPRTVGSREQFPQPFEIVGVKNWSQGDSNPSSSREIPTQFPRGNSQKGPNQAQSVTARAQPRRRR